MNRSKAKRNRDRSYQTQTKRFVALVLICICIGLSGRAGIVGNAPSAKTPMQPKISLSQPLTVRWRYASSATLNLTPAADSTRIYLPLAGGTIVSLGAGEGQLFWKSEVGGEFSAAPVADDRAIYVAAETTATEADKNPVRGSLRALGHEAGVTTWLRTLPVAIRGSLALTDDRIFGGASDGGFYSIDKSSGNTVWFVQTGSPLHCTPVIANKTVYAGGEDGKVISLEESTGKVRWRYETHGPVRGPIAVFNDAVFFGSGDGYVYAVGATDGRLRWRTRTGAGVQAVMSVPTGLLVASLDNFVYLLAFNRGKRLWKRQLPGRVSAQPVTADDGALFTPLSSDAVVLTLRDGKKVNSLPTGEGSNTAASPVVIADTVFLTTDQGLLAFSAPSSPGKIPGKTKP